MDSLTLTIIMLVFYGGLSFGLYLRVQTKKHRSRSSIKSFFFVSGSILGAILASSMFVWLVVSLFDLQRGSVTTAFGAGAIVISVVRAWRWSFAKVEIAIDGFKFEKPPEVRQSSMISKDQYLAKYRTSEKRLMSAISNGKVKSSIESGVLVVEDKKC